MMHYPDREQVEMMVAEAGGGKLRVPVCREILADLLTPVAAYLRVASDSQYAFLLESVEGGERVGRYSFIGSNPRTVLYLNKGLATTISFDAVSNSYCSTAEQPFSDPLTAIQQVMGEYKLLIADGLRLPRFAGGAVGFLGYEAVGYFEQLVSPTTLHPLGTHLPEAAFMFADEVIAFDHVRQRIQVISHLTLEADSDISSLYEATSRRIDSLLAQLIGNLAATPAPTAHQQAAAGGVESADQLTYESYVERAKEYIRAGDIFQVVPSRRLVREFTGSPLNVYRAMRAINPSPYMYLLQLGAAAIVGASPEMLVRVQDGTITSHPIAGTRPRGANEAQDAYLAAELLADPKECAEHIMLVDLSRNDIGRVAVPGSVRVSRLMEVEQYSHVMHIVSEVQGRLKPELSGVDALRACFPAGTLTGAPKIRAMQIIAELEGQQRGPYGGAVGYIGYDGNLDTCITIRTVVLAEGKAAVQAGAGIVADSDPTSEYRETESKLEGVLRALAMAEQL